jgi:ribonuclease-3
LAEDRYYPPSATISRMLDDQELDAFESRLGYRFRDRSQLEMALTHRSWVNEKDTGQNYERVEFLGDAVLGLLTSEWLYERHPGAPEGRLSKMKSYVVSEPVLARWARDLGLGEALRLGVGEDRSGGRSKPSLLADALEAVLGVMYLESGLGSVKSVLEPLLVQTLGADLENADTAGFKSSLQELIQSRGIELPSYRHVAEEGPDHDKRFHVECWVDSQCISEGVGATKKQAEQRAARAALERMNQQNS